MKENKLNQDIPEWMKEKIAEDSRNICIGLVERASFREGAEWAIREFSLKGEGMKAEIILRRLINLKKHKDEFGKDSFYEKEQPEVWQAAFNWLSKSTTEQSITNDNTPDNE